MPSRATRRWLLIDALLAVLVLFAGWQLWRYAHSEPFLERARHDIAFRLSAATGRVVEIDAIRYSVWPTQVLVTGLRIHNPPGTKRPYFLIVRELEVRGNIASLGRRRLDLQWIAARGLELDIETLPDGSTNLPKMRGEPGERAIEINIGRLSVTPGRFFYEHHEVPLSFDAEGIVAALEQSARGFQFAGQVRTRRTTFSLMDYEPVTFGLNARVDVGEHRIRFEQVELRGDDLWASGSGQMVAPHFRDFLFDFDARAEASLVDAVFGTDTGLAGPVTARAKLRGGPGGVFTLAGTWEAEHIDLPPRRFGEPSGDFEVTDEHVHVTVAKARYAGGTVHGRFEMHDMHEPYRTDVRVDGEGVDMEMALADLGLEASGLAGTGTVEFRHRFPVQDFDAGSGSGRLRIAARSGIAATGAAGEKRVPISADASFTLARGLVRIAPGATLHTPAARAALGGTIAIADWTPDLTVDYETADLAELTTVLDNLIASGGGKRGLFPRLAGAGTFRGTFRNSFSDPHLAGELTVQRGKYEAIELGDLAGQASYRAGLVELSPLTARNGGETLRLQGTIAWDAPAQGRDDLDLAIEAQRWPVEKIAKLFDLELPLTGRATGSVRLHGEYEALDAEGSLALADGTLMGEPYLEITGDLAMHAGVLEGKNVAVTLAAGTIVAEGTFDPGKESFTLLAQGSALDASRLSFLRGLEGRLRGSADFNLSGYGSLEAPQLVAELRLSKVTVDGEPLPEDAKAYVTWGADGLTARADLGDLLRLEGDVAFRDDTAFVGSVRFRSSRLELLAPFLAQGGVPITGNLEGELTLSGDTRELADTTIVGALSRVDITLREQRLTNAAPVAFQIENQTLTLLNVNLASGNSRFYLVGTAGLKAPYPLALNAQGTIDAAIAQLFLPRTQIGGQLAILASVRGSGEAPRISGLAELRDGFFRLSGFPNGVEDMQGMVVFDGERVTLDGLTGRMGGGEVLVSGEATLERYALARYRVQLTGRDVGLRYPLGTRSRIDAELVLAGDPGAAVLRGQVKVLSAVYTADIEQPGVTDMLVSRKRRVEPSLSSGWGRNIALDVHIEAPGTLAVRNNVARMKGSAELVLRGSIANPLLFGRVELDEDGFVEFRGVRYQVRSGTVNFVSPYKIDPVFDIIATTRARSYEITLNLSGTLERITPLFTSDPPLSDLDIVALLYFGKTAEELTAGAGQGVSVASASQLLAGQVFEQISKRGRTLFGLDRFQIDPFLVGPEANPTARITVGKQFSKDLSVTYSTNLATNQEQILVIEYQISRDLFLVASREADGSYALDLRYEKRY